MALPARPYDPLYDTTYTVSGARDHYRQQTVAGGFMVDRAPDFPNMFSELPHHPASTFRLKNSDKVPGFVDRTFQPQIKTANDLAIRSQSDMVNGQQRYQYFRRPMLAASQPSMVVKQAVVAAQPPPPPAPPEPKSKTIATQSDYRESEAQTMPWEPSITLPETVTEKQSYLSSRHHCEGPELLQLKDLKFADGLPPGLQEVLRVEKMREKRAFEATLPPLNDLHNLPIRQKMIEQWEAKEWDEREREILSVQDERLVLIDQALQAREEEFDQATSERVEQRKVEMLQGKTHELASIQASRIKTMRQLIESRKYVERHRKLVKPTIVERYANFGSSTYAPVQREGRFPESKPQNKAIETEGFQPVTLNGIAELEAFMPRKLLDLHVSSPRNKTPAKGDYQQRQEAAMQRDLKTINDLLGAARSTKGLGVGECWPAPLKESEAKLVSSASLANLDSKASLSARRKSVVRVADKPEIPELPPPVSMTPAGEQHAAAILIQRLLRGRAAQNVLFEGKTHRMHLIKEIQLEGSKEAATGRPEDTPLASIQMDAMLGTLISQLATACCTTDAAQRDQLLTQAVSKAVASCAQAPDPVALLEAVRPLSRQSTPTQVGSLEQPQIELQQPVRPASPCEAEQEPEFQVVRAMSPNQSQQHDEEGGLQDFAPAEQSEAAVQEMNQAQSEADAQQEAIASRPGSSGSVAAAQEQGDGVPPADAVLDDSPQQEVVQDQEPAQEEATLDSQSSELSQQPGEVAEPGPADEELKQAETTPDDAAEASAAAPVEQPSPREEEVSAAPANEAAPEADAGVASDETPAEHEQDTAPSSSSSPPPPPESAVEVAAESAESAAPTDGQAEPAANEAPTDSTTALSDAELPLAAPVADAPEAAPVADTPEAAPEQGEQEAEVAPAEDASEAAEPQLKPENDKAQPDSEAAAAVESAPSTEQPEGAAPEEALEGAADVPPVEHDAASGQEDPPPAEPEPTADSAPEEVAEANPVADSEPEAPQPPVQADDVAESQPAPEPEPDADSQPAPEPEVDADSQPAPEPEAVSQEPVVPDVVESDQSAAEELPAADEGQQSADAAEHDGGPLLPEATLGDVAAAEPSEEPALAPEATLGAVVGQEGDADEDEQITQQPADAEGSEPEAQVAQEGEEVPVPDLGAAAEEAHGAQHDAQAPEVDEVLAP